MEMERIKHSYLVVLHIPVYRAANGTTWTDQLWYKDLLEHVEYIDDFTLACPCINVRRPPPNQVKVEDIRIKFVFLPGRYGLTLNLPATALRL